MFPTWYILYLEVGTLLVATHVSIGMSSAAYMVSLSVDECVCVYVCAWTCLCIRACEQ